MGNERGGEEREFVVCPRKKKEKSAPMLFGLSDLLQSAIAKVHYSQDPL